MAKSQSDKTDKDYWGTYTNLQHIKHEALRRYLGGWYPKMASWSKRILYVETHAGRGKHAVGKAGSPIIALKTLLDHRSLGEITAGTEVVFILMEEREDSAKALRKEVKHLGKMPKNVDVHVLESDYQEQLGQVLKGLKKSKKNLAPGFFFIDPYSFVLSMPIMAQIMEYQSTELFVNCMWRHLSMAIANETQAGNMDTMFGEGNWEDLAGITDNDKRCETAVERLRLRLGVEHAWLLKMHGKNRALKYALVHFSNHIKGLELMKDVAWALSPRGDFRFWQSDDPDQDIFLTEDPDLTPLAAQLIESHGGDTIRLQDAYDSVLMRTVFRKPHYHGLVKQWHKDGHLHLPDGESKVVVSKNPRITIPNELP